VTAPQAAPGSDSIFPGRLTAVLVFLLLFPGLAMPQGTVKSPGDPEIMRDLATGLEDAGFLKSERLFDVLATILQESSIRQHVIEDFERGDHAAALVQLRKIAESGDPLAEFYVGFSYDRGLGIEQDFTEAVRWYGKSAEHGLPVAQNNLAVKYARGQGIAKDQVQAFKWFIIAGELGSEPASLNLKKLEKTVTAAQQSEARKLADDWLARFRH